MAIVDVIAFVVEGGQERQVDLPVRSRPSRAVLGERIFLEDRYFVVYRVDHDPELRRDTSVHNRVVCLYLRPYRQPLLERLGGVFRRRHATMIVRRPPVAAGPVAMSTASAPRLTLVPPVEEEEDYAAWPVSTEAAILPAGLVAALVLAGWRQNKIRWRAERNTALTQAEWQHAHAKSRAAKRRLLQLADELGKLYGITFWAYGMRWGATSSVVVSGQRLPPAPFLAQPAPRQVLHAVSNE